MLFSDFVCSLKSLKYFNKILNILFIALSSNSPEFAPSDINVFKLLYIVSLCVPLLSVYSSSSLFFCLIYLSILSNTPLISPVVRIAPPIIVLKPPDNSVLGSLSFNSVIGNGNVIVLSSISIFSF